MSKRRKRLNKYQDGGQIEALGEVVVPRNDAYYANRKKISLMDNRTIDGVTGGKVSDKSRFSANADLETVIDLVAQAKAQGLDPYTVLAIGLQETGLAPHGDTEANPLHILGGSTFHEDEDPIRESVKFLKDKFALGASLGKTEEADLIQAFNGYGKLRPTTENIGNKAYGIDISKNPIDMNKTPVYGKRIIDLRDNIIKNSPEIRTIVEGIITEEAPTLPVSPSILSFGVTENGMKMGGIAKFKQGGLLRIGNYQMGTYVTDPNDPRLQAYQDSLFLNQWSQPMVQAVQQNPTPNAFYGAVQSLFEPGMGPTPNSLPQNYIPFRKGYAESRDAIDRLEQNTGERPGPIRLHSTDFPEGQRNFRTGEYAAPKQVVKLAPKTKEGLSQYNKVVGGQLVPISKEEYDRLTKDGAEIISEDKYVDKNKYQIKKQQVGGYIYPNQNSAVPMGAGRRPSQRIAYMGGNLDNSLLIPKIPGEDFNYTNPGMLPMYYHDDDRALVDPAYVGHSAAYLPLRQSVGTSPLESLTLSQLESERPIVVPNNPFHEEGEHVIPWQGVPNLKVVMRKNKGESNMKPWAIENADGKRISYKDYKDKQLPKDFQYQMGGIPMKRKYQLGGIADLLGSLSGLGDYGLFGNDFTFQDAQRFGNDFLPGETLQAHLFDSGEPFVNAGLGRLSQGQSQNEMENFLQSPTLEGLDIYGQGLPSGVGRRARRRIERGQPLTRRQQRLLGQSAQAALPTQQQNLQTGYRDQATGLGNIFDMFQGLLNFQQGGIAQQGFSENSPYKTRKEIRIPGGTVTMRDTNIPLALIPDRGRAVIAPPRSGRYVFPGATSVREVRLFQLGGEVENPFLPVQLEKGEMIVLPDVSIVDTKAKKSHKEMKKDVVTDILPDGSFVGSADKKTLLKKKKAEKISFGYEPVDYSEGKIGKEPKEILFSDIFKDDEKMLPADLLRRIQRTFPISDRECDPFTDRAIEENKESRVPYIAATVFMTKNDPSQLKLGGQIKHNISDLLNRQQEYTNTNIPNTPPVPDVSEGAKGGRVKKYQVGDIVQGAASLAMLPFNIFMSAQQRGDARRQLQANLGAINQGAANQQRFAGLGTGLGVASTLAQNPYVSAPQFDLSAIQALPQQIPQSIFDTTAARMSGAQRPIINSIFENTGNFSRAVNSVAPFSAQRISGLADLGLNSAMQNINLRRDYLTRLNDIKQRQILADTDALNRTRGNSNSLISQLGNLGIGYTNQLGQIDANRVTNTLGARGANFAAQQQALQNLTSGVNSFLGSAAGGSLNPLFGNQPSPGSTGLPVNPNTGWGQLADETCPCNAYDSLGNCLC